MFNNDKSSWGGSGKKEKRVKSAPKKPEGKKLIGGGDSFGGSSSFGKDSDKKSLFNKEKKKKASFGGGSSFGKESGAKSPFNKDKKEKNSIGKNADKKPIFGRVGNDKSAFGDDSGGEKVSFLKKLKWWHILLSVLGVAVIIVAIIAAVLIGKVNDIISGGIGGGLGDAPITEGIVSSCGTFLPDGTPEYILCQYTEYFSSETIQLLQKPGDVRYDYKAYYLLFLENGEPYYQYSGEYTGEKTPEEIKAEILTELKERYKYTDESLLHCSVVLYEPVSFTRVVISSVAIADDGSASIKYKAGALDGEMSDEYELIGAYTKIDNDFTFSYTNLPEEENLLYVAENLLASAKYDYYSQYGAWVNELTFGDYSLYLATAEETPEI